MTPEAYRPAAERLPWTPTAVVVALAANGLALLLVLAGWYGGSNEAAAADVARWADVSATGLVVAAVGNGVLLGGARARIGTRQRAMARDRAQRLPDGAALLASTVGDDVVGLPGQSLAHLSSCALVAGKPARVLDTAERAERTPCGWCRP